ncbi:MAG: MGMT family protein [Cyanobacteria bacterium]|nr:MGMT family protein [Cyanobacteriota bacterium]
MGKKIQPREKDKIKTTGTFVRVYEIVRQIPEGRVLTYGTISNFLDGRLSAQGVGWALNALPSGPASVKDRAEYTSETVPWQRVVNSRGGISTWKTRDVPPDLQQRLLEDEGIVFGADGLIDLKRYLWIEGLSGDIVVK